MRRVIPIAAFALVLTLPVWAQRGGRGSGMRGGFVSRGTSGHSFSGMRSGPSFSRNLNHSFGWGSTSFNRGFGNRSFHGRGFGGHRHHNLNRFGFNSCFGFGCGWGGWSPWWGTSYYDPWVWSTWDDQDRRFDEDYYRQYEMADRWNQRSLEEQQARRQQEEDAEEDAYASRSSDRRSFSDSVSQSQDPAAATVLVYRDQHRQEVQNYAIVGQTLWAFMAGRTQKIPLASLDVEATERVNDERGIPFRAPAGNQGQ